MARLKLVVVISVTVGHFHGVSVIVIEVSYAGLLVVLLDLEATSRRQGLRRFIARASHLVLTFSVFKLLKRPGRKHLLRSLVWASKHFELVLLETERSRFNRSVDAVFWGVNKVRVLGRLVVCLVEDFRDRLQIEPGYFSFVFRLLDIFISNILLFEFSFSAQIGREVLDHLRKPSVNELLHGPLKIFI